MADITIAYSNHRPETLRHTAELMRKHQIVFLEEAPDPAFARMLDGTLGVEAYVARLDTEYPEFSRQACRMVRTLHANGTRFEQVEPFIERLIQIHELFARGQEPSAVLQMPVLSSVYAAEKEATRTLIDFYETALQQPFDAVLSALKAFARADAARFRLRDRMRADALEHRMGEFHSCYIEAGSMHFWLGREMKRRLSGSRHTLQRHYPMAEATRAATGRIYLMGPGDDLTLRYIYNPEAASPTIDLLAARSLIFNKILAKTEIVGSADASPHLLDEWRALQKANRLQINDCKALFPRVRTASTAAANAAVDAYLGMGSIPN
jgi:hypothetical protein